MVPFFCRRNNLFFLLPDQTINKTGLNPWRNGLTLFRNTMFVSILLVRDKKVTPDLRRKQQCLANNVGQFRQAFSMSIQFSISQFEIHSKVQ